MSASRSRTRLSLVPYFSPSEIFSTESIFLRRCSVSVVAAAGSAGLRRLKTSGQPLRPAWRNEFPAGDYAERLRRFCRDCGEKTPHEGAGEFGDGWRGGG